MKSDLEIVIWGNGKININADLKYIKIKQFYYVQCWNCGILINSKTEPTETNSSQVFCNTCAESVFEEFENY